MRIFIDIGHPHEVHFFKYFIREMIVEGHEFMITARDRELIFELLRKEKIDFIDRGKGSNSIIGKFFLFFKIDFFLYRKAKKFNPDVLLGFGSFYITHVAFLLKKPGVLFYDTEHSWFINKLYIPFCKAIITPNSYLSRHGKKHFMFKGHKELSHLIYLEKNEISTKKYLGIEANEKYVILRFISKNAFHDVFYKGFSTEEKIKLVDFFKTKAEVFISSEGELPTELKPYELKIKPDKIHEVLASASLFIGEGATMAAESALLGVPSIYNYMRFGYLKELEEEGLLKYSKSIEDIFKEAKSILDNDGLQEFHHEKANGYLKSCIDITKFMKWFVSNYPNSLKILRSNPDYQFNFKIK